MRFLADENLERLIVERLQGLGHDVATIPADAAGNPDSAVLDRAVSEQRILITNDKDFAELAFLQKKSTPGIILVRLPRSATPEKAERVLEVIQQLSTRLADVFTVIEPEATRRRPFLSIRSTESS